MITRACIYLYIRRSSFNQRDGRGGGGGGGGGELAAGRLNGRAQFISKQAVVDGDCGFHPTSELVLTRTVDGDGDNDGDLRSHPAGR